MMSNAQKSTTRYYCAQLFVLLSLIIIPASSSAAIAELAWIEAHSLVKNIRFANYDGSTWEVKPEPVYVSERPLTSLALGTDQQGKKILIWTEKTTVKSVLMFMTGSPNEDGKLSWSSAELFSDYGRENFSASIVYDRTGVGWVFWAATTRDYSDVVFLNMYSLSRDEPQYVHKINKVPDNRPKASINSDGHVSVEWTSFDFASDGYISKEQNFPSISEPVGALEELVDVVTKADVSPFPTEMRDEGNALLHFPDNQMIQSVSLNTSR